MASSAASPPRTNLLATDDPGGGGVPARCGTRAAVTAVVDEAQPGEPDRRVAGWLEHVRHAEETQRPQARPRRSLAGPGAMNSG